jgi:hypothetical protein
VVKLKLLVVYVKNGLAKLLLDDLILFLGLCHVDHAPILAVELPKSVLINPVEDLAAEFLKQALTGYLDDEAHWDLVGSAADPEQAKVTVQLSGNALTLIVKPLLVNFLQIHNGHPVVYQYLEDDWQLLSCH